MHAFPMAIFALFGLACTGDEIAPSNVVQQPVQQEEPTPIVAKDGSALTMMDGATVEWVGAKVTAEHNGGFRQVSGAAIVSDGILLQFDAQVQISSLFSDREKLTKHLVGPDFFDADKFANASFESTKIDQGKATGFLSLHGVRKAITFPVKIETTATGSHVQAEMTINRQDFGISYPGRVDDLIKDDVLIRADVHYSSQ